MQPIVLRNGDQSVTFVPNADGKTYKPEWFRLGDRPMLRFKDHEFLNVGHLRVTEGEPRERSDKGCTFAGVVEFGGAMVAWSVRIAAADGPGFTVATSMTPVSEPIEVLEAMTAFETPYEYDGAEISQTVISQQPVYRTEGDNVICGAGFTAPHWYYGKTGKAHLTYQSATPLMVNRVHNADGSNERCTMILGNWNVCDSRDLFMQPTRWEGGTKTGGGNARPDGALRGNKFIVGCVNWNHSLVKDPNVLVEPGRGLRQEVVVDFRGSLPDGKWDGWLAAGWERLCRIHLPADGIVPAHRVARSAGASWVESADWLRDQFNKPEGCNGFFHSDRGTAVYAPGTRPKWDNGVHLFSAQWTGPLSYLSLAWNDPAAAAASDVAEASFNRAKPTELDPSAVWTIGWTPFVVALMRKMLLGGATDESKQKARDFVTRKGEFLLNPPRDAKRGDCGIWAWDALANLLAAELFDREKHEATAKKLLERVNAQLDGEFWKFNFAAEGDLVGAGNARPFGHGVASSANFMAWQRFKDGSYLDAAQRFGNLLLAMHYITWNESPSPDLDTRGWAHGSTGGRDQTAQLPPWETAFGLQQFAPLMAAGKGRPGMYDVLWLHSKTGLAMFPKARTVKRLYKPDMSITYRDIHSLPTERAFYLRLPYMAYENPWDQTMLAGYQGVEPVLLSLFYGGGLVGAEDERVAAFVPEAAAYAPGIAKGFEVQLWNPTPGSVTTRLHAEAAVRRKAALRFSGAATGMVSADQPWTGPITVPSRQVVMLRFEA